MEGGFFQEPSPSPGNEHRVYIQHAAYSHVHTCFGHKLFAKRHSFGGLLGSFPKGRKEGCFWHLCAEVKAVSERNLSNHSSEGPLRCLMHTEIPAWGGSGRGIMSQDQPGLYRETLTQETGGWVFGGYPPISQPSSGCVWSMDAGV